MKKSNFNFAAAVDILLVSFKLWDVDAEKQRRHDYVMYQMLTNSKNK